MCASAHAPVHGERGGGGTGQAHNAEREESGVRGNGSVTGDLGPREREREGARE
jgi:hypothetical protein